MANILDYLDWRGDVTFKGSPLNEIDQCILARLAYLPMDGIVSEPISVKEAMTSILENKENIRWLLEDDEKLCTKLLSSARYRDLVLNYFVNVVDAEEEEQFAAVTILDHPNDRVIVSFRGTDNTLVGWKEDFNISFLNQIAAQESASEYLENILNQEKGEVIVCGHSKGGALSVYSAAMSKHTKRIKAIYNNDGPGLHQEVIDTSHYQQIKNKITKYMPEGSIIGQILENDEPVVIIDSTAHGAYQHDLFSWQVLGNKFIGAKQTLPSQFMDQQFKDWIVDIPPEQKAKFVKVLFEILESGDAAAIKDLKGSDYLEMFKTLVELDVERRKILLDTLGLLGSSMARNMKVFLKGLWKQDE